MSSTPFPPPLLSSADIQLDRDIFLRALLRELSGTLENVVGLDDASGFISVVGQRVGEWIEAEYRAVLGSSQMDREQVTAVLIDRKHGTFWGAAGNHGEDYGIAW